jgi:hypothetical protein
LTVIVRSPRIVPFSRSMAVRAACSSLISTKPKPLLRPVSTFLNALTLEETVSHRSDTSIF